MTLDELKNRIGGFFDAAIAARSGSITRIALRAAKVVALREVDQFEAMLSAAIARGDATAALNHLRDFLKGKLDAEVNIIVRNLFNLDRLLDAAFDYLIAHEPVVLMPLGGKIAV